MPAVIDRRFSATAQHHALFVAIPPPHGPLTAFNSLWSPFYCGVRAPIRATPFTSTCGRITLSRLDDLPRLPRDAEGPVFAEPWQAQAFALAVKLSEQGYFTWKEWAAALANELKSAADRGEPDDGSRYYQHWLAALERLVQSKGLAEGEALAARKEAWAEAYRRTPHGKPVELGPAD